MINKNIYAYGLLFLLSSLFIGFKYTITSVAFIINFNNDTKLTRHCLINIISILFFGYYNTIKFNFIRLIYFLFLNKTYIINKFNEKIKTIKHLRNLYNYNNENKKIDKEEKKQKEFIKNLLNLIQSTENIFKIIKQYILENKNIKAFIFYFKTIFEYFKSNDYYSKLDYVNNTLEKWIKNIHKKMLNYAIYKEYFNLMNNHINSLIKENKNNNFDNINNDDVFKNILNEFNNDILNNNNFDNFDNIDNFNNIDNIDIDIDETKLKELMNNFTDNFKNINRINKEKNE